jgi:hypothetical protein
MAEPYTTHREAETRAKEFFRALDTYRNRLLFNRNQGRRLISALDVLVESLPENTTILELARSASLVIHNTLLQRRELFQQAQSINIANEKVVEIMWELEWSVHRRHTLIKQQEAMCQKNDAIEQEIRKGMLVEMASLEDETSRRNMLRAEHVREWAQNASLLQKETTNADILTRLQLERAYELDHSGKDTRVPITYRKGCRFCGFENGTVFDCQACQTINSSRDSISTICALLARVSIDCRREHLVRLSPKALDVFCRHLRL